MNLRNTNWVFGKNAGLNFSSGGITSFSTSLMNTIEGCASISDNTTGNLILYTDGVKVWDGSGTVRASGLLGNASSTQSAVVVPDPGNPTRYYIFTTNGAHFNGILIKAVPWGLPLPLTWLSPLPPTTGYTSTEKLVGVRHANQKDFWVLTLVESGGSAGVGPGILRGFLVTASGVSWTGDQPLGHNISTVGYLKGSPSGRYIAMANFWAGTVLVVPFSNSTGMINVGGLITIHTTPVPPPHNAGAPYGVEFSRSGKILYYTTIYAFAAVNGPVTDGLLYQFILPSGPPLLLAAHPRTFALWWNDLCALQLGSDGRIYIAQNLEQKLGVIANPDLYGTACNVTLSALPVAAGSTCNIGLPNMIRGLF